MMPRGVCDKNAGALAMEAVFRRGTISVNCRRGLSISLMMGRAFPLFLPNCRAGKESTATPKRERQKWVVPLLKRKWMKKGTRSGMSIRPAMCAPLRPPSSSVLASVGKSLHSSPATRCVRRWGSLDLELGGHAFPRRRADSGPLSCLRPLGPDRPIDLFTDNGRFSSRAHSLDGPAQIR
jgi:hypothetical protein